MIFVAWSGGSEATEDQGRAADGYHGIKVCLKKSAETHCNV